MRVAHVPHVPPAPSPSPGAGCPGASPPAAPPASPREPREAPRRSLYSALSPLLPPEDIAELQSLGLEDLRYHDLADLSRHGVTMDYIRKMVQTGLRLNSDDLPPA